MLRGLTIVLVAFVLIGCTTPVQTSSPQPTVVPTAATLQMTITPSFPALTPPNATPENLTGTIVIDGSSTVFPITEVAAIAFRSYLPQVEIRLGVSGTGGGFKKFCAGETVIANASRPISSAEAEICAQAGIEYIELPIAFDGISLVVHPENTWATCMTVAELRTLWEPEAEGVVLHWNQIRSDWPATPVQLYGAGGDSGTYDYFTEAIIGKARSSRQDYTASEDDYLLVQDLAADPAGLGFFGYAYYVEHAEKLRVLGVDSGAGCVTPNVESIASGTYQPLARPIFLYVQKAALDRPDLRTFVTFYLANAPALVREARYIPLPDSAYTLISDRVTRQVTGSVFTGTSPVGVSVDQLLHLEETP